MPRNQHGYVHPVEAPLENDPTEWENDPLGKLIGMAPSDTYVPLHELPNWHQLTEPEKEALRILPLHRSYFDVSRAIGKAKHWLTERKSRNSMLKEAIEVRERVTALDARRYFMDEVTSQAFLELHRILMYGTSGDSTKLKAAQYLVDRDDRLRKAAAKSKETGVPDENAPANVSEMLSWNSG